MKLKKWISLLLSTLMLVSVFPASMLVEAAGKVSLELEYYEYTPATANPALNAGTVGNKISDPTKLQEDQNFVVAVKLTGLHNMSTKGMVRFSAKIEYTFDYFKQQYAPSGPNFPDNISGGSVFEGTGNKALNSGKIQSLAYGVYETSNADVAVSATERATKINWVCNIQAMDASIAEANDTAYVGYFPFQTKKSTPNASTAGFELVDMVLIMAKPDYVDGSSLVDSSNLIGGSIAQLGDKFESPAPFYVGIQGTPSKQPVATIARSAADAATIDVSVSNLTDGTTQSAVPGDAKFNVYANIGSADKLIAKDQTLTGGKFTVTAADLSASSGATLAEAQAALNMGGAFKVTAIEDGKDESDKVEVSGVAKRTNNATGVIVATQGAGYVKPKVIKDTAADSASGITAPQNMTYAVPLTFNPETGAETPAYSQTLTNPSWKTAAAASGEIGTEVNITGTFTAPTGVDLKSYTTVTVKAEIIDDSVVSFENPTAITMYANDARNATETDFDNTVKAVTVPAKMSSAPETTVQRLVTWTKKASQPAYDAKGKTYVYESEILKDGQTAELTVTVNPVTATVTNQPAATKELQINAAGYADATEMGLETQVNVAYTPEAASAPSATPAISWTGTVPADFGKTADETGATMTWNLTAALPAWATVSGAITGTTKVTVADKDRTPITALAPVESKTIYSNDANAANPSAALAAETDVTAPENAGKVSITWGPAATATEDVMDAADNTKKIGTKYNYVATALSADNDNYTTNGFDMTTVTASVTVLDAVWTIQNHPGATATMFIDSNAITDPATIAKRAGLPEKLLINSNVTGAQQKEPTIAYSAKTTIDPAFGTENGQTAELHWATEAAVTLGAGETIVLPAGITQDPATGIISGDVTVSVSAEIGELDIIGAVNSQGSEDDILVIRQNADGYPKTGNVIGIYSDEAGANLIGSQIQVGTPVRVETETNEDDSTTSYNVYEIKVPSTTFKDGGTFYAKFALNNIEDTSGVSELKKFTVSATPNLTISPKTMNKNATKVVNVNVSGEATIKEIEDVYSSDSKLSVSKREAGSTSFTAKSGSNSGTVTITIKAKITDTATGIDYTVSNDDTMKINNSGGSGGSSGGGNNNGGTIIVPPTTTPNGYFDDLGTVPWAETQINTLAQYGYVAGISDRTFAPNDNVTRAQFTKMLVEVFGLTTADTNMNFADMTDSSAWYYNYVAIGTKAGIVKGYADDNTFQPNREITRQEMAAMLGRACEAVGFKPAATQGAETFTDADEIMEYAMGYIEQMQKAGVINGMGDGTFSPKGNATRAQAAKVVCEIFNKRMGM